MRADAHTRPILRCSARAPKSHAHRAQICASECARLWPPPPPIEANPMNFCKWSEWSALSGRAPPIPMKAQAPIWPPPMTSTGRTSPELTAPPQSHCSFVSRGLARLAAYDLRGPCRIDRAGRLADAPFGFDGRRARSLGTRFGTARSNGHRTLQMIGDTGRGPPIPMTAQAPIWSPPMRSTRRASPELTALLNPIVLFYPGVTSIGGARMAGPLLYRPGRSPCGGFFRF